jgi:Flp pilus assembly protein protease CpaA
MGTIGLPFFGAALVCLLLAWQGYTATQAFILYCLVAGVVGMVSVAMFYWRRAIEPVDVAWQMVAPALLEDKTQPFGWAHSEFLASLAKASVGRGSIPGRDAVVARHFRLSIWLSFVTCG